MSPFPPFLRGALAVFRNEVRLELRTRYGLSALGLFVAASLVLVLFAVGPEGAEPRTTSALLWIVVLFAGAVGLGRAFVAEEERGTTRLLQLHVRPSAVLTGKLAFNAALTAALTVAAAVGFRVLLGAVPLAPGLLAVALAGGALGLAATMTLLSALIARASGRGPLLPVLAFPLLVPLLLSVVRLTERALILPPNEAWALSDLDLTSLFAFCGLVLTAGALLFDTIWRA